MNISQRLRTCAKHTGLDAVIELLQEAADEIDALQARAQVQGEPVTVAVDHFDNGPFEAYTNRIHPPVEIGTKLYTTPQPAQATQAEAQQPVTGEPVYWEWRHLSTHPDTVDFGKWSEWKRVEARSAIHTIDDALAEFRAYIAQGYKYELRALYTHPAPSVPDDVVRDAERYRWLADCNNYEAGLALIIDPKLTAHTLGEKIDAAMLAAK